MSDDYEKLPKATSDGRPLVWLTTACHPRVADGSKRSHTHGADDGQIGWRVHALIGPESAVTGYYKVPRPVALCGTRPVWGWGLDLFIDRPCVRCLKALDKLDHASGVGKP